MKKFLILVITTILFSGCNNNSDNNDFLLNHLEQYKGKVKLSDLLSDCELIPLETKPECLIGNIMKIVEDNGRLYINSDDNRLLVFDKEGKFLRQISSQGGGPEEYSSIRDFDVKDSLIVIMEAKKINYYLLDGSFERSIRLPEIGGNIKLLPDKKIMLHVGGDSPILIINAKGEILNRYLKPNLALSIGKTAAFDALGDSVLFQNGAFGNDLWSYNEKTGQTKSFKLINNENALSTEQECKLIKERGIRYADDPDVFNISQLAVAGEQLVFGSKYQNHLYINIGNARTSSSVVYQLYPQSQIDDDITYTETYICLQYVYAVSSSDKHFFSFIQPSIIRESLEEKQRYRDEINYGKVKEMIDNLPDPDNANPILIEFNFKS